MPESRVSVQSLSNTLDDNIVLEIISLISLVKQIVSNAEQGLNSSKSKQNDLNGLLPFPSAQEPLKALVVYLQVLEHSKVLWSDLKRTFLSC